jgi:hypothetical protein
MYCCAEIFPNMAGLGYEFIGKFCPNIGTIFSGGLLALFYRATGPMG